MLENVASPCCSRAKMLSLSSLLFRTSTFSCKQVCLPRSRSAFGMVVVNMVIVATAIVMMDIWGRIFFVGNNNTTKNTINRITVDDSMATNTLAAVAISITTIITTIIISCLFLQRKLMRD